MEWKGGVFRDFLLSWAEITFSNEKQQRAKICRMLVLHAAYFTFSGYKFLLIHSENAVKSR